MEPRGPPLLGLTPFCALAGVGCRLDGRDLACLWDSCAAGMLTGMTAFSESGAMLGARLSEGVSLGSSMVMELGRAGQLTCIVPAQQTMHTSARSTKLEINKAI